MRAATPDGHNCAEFREESPRPRAGRAARPVLSELTRCSTGREEWLPIRNRFRTPRVSWSENQGVRRFVRNAGPDPSRKCEHFLQIEIRGLTQGENDEALNGHPRSRLREPAGVTAGTRGYTRAMIANPRSSGAPALGDRVRRSPSRAPPRMVSAPGL